MASMQQLENATRLMENEDWSALPQAGDITPEIIQCAALVAGRESRDCWDFTPEDTPLIVGVLRRGFTAHGDAQEVVDADDEMAETLSRLIEHKVSPSTRDDVVQEMADALIVKARKNGQAVVDTNRDDDVPKKLRDRVGYVIFGREV